MKKLLVGLLALGSISVFADEVKCIEGEEIRKVQMKVKTRTISVFAGTKKRMVFTGFRNVIDGAAARWPVYTDVYKDEKLHKAYIEMIHTNGTTKLWYGEISSKGSKPEEMKEDFREFKSAKKHKYRVCFNEGSRERFASRLR